MLGESFRSWSLRFAVMAALACAVVWSTFALAQGTDPASDNAVAEGRALVQAARDDIIRTELNLSPAEAADFWPVYARYKTDTKEVMDRYTHLVTDYLQRYDSGDISAEYADDLVVSFFALKRELLDTQESYVPRFRQALPAVKVAQLYQLENKINAEIDAQLAISIPLIE